MNDHVDPTVALQRNIELLKQHGQAVERVKDLESQLAQIDAVERNEAEKYAMGYRNDPPVPLDEQRAELVRLLAGARPAARTAELAVPALMACQAEIRQRIEAQKSVQSTSIVEQMCADDQHDSDTIAELTEHILDLLHRRKVVRQFLGEQGRQLVQRGDTAHGTEILRRVEGLDPLRVPVFDLDQRKVQQATAEIAARFARRGKGQ
jgi:hypothetical protein